MQEAPSKPSILIFLIREYSQYGLMFREPILLYAG